MSRNPPGIWEILGFREILGDLRNFKIPERFLTSRLGNLTPQNRKPPSPSHSNCEGGDHSAQNLRAQRAEESQEEVGLIYRSIISLRQGGECYEDHEGCPCD